MSSKPDKIDDTSSGLFLQESEGTSSSLRLVPSGSTLLDLTMSGTMEGAYALGGTTNIVGDKSSGKTLLALEAMSSARRKYPDSVIRFAEIEAAFDDSLAHKMGMPIDTFERPDPPIETIDEFYRDIKQSIAGKEAEVPLIYILDSLDALMTEEEQKQEDFTATGKAFGQRAKQLGEFLRKMKREFADNSVLLIINSQVRENIGAGMYQKKHKRAAGKALDHYESQELWLAEIGKLKKGETPIGIIVKAKTEKNKIWVPYRETEFNILWNYGIDDIQSMINYTTTLEGQSVTLFGQKMTVKKMIKHIEEKGLVDDLKKLVKAKWDGIEAKLAVDRRSKWG